MGSVELGTRVGREVIARSVQRVSIREKMGRKLFMDKIFFRVH